MKDTQRIQLVTDPTKAAMELGSMVAGLVLLWYLSDPSSFDRLIEKVRLFSEKCVHRISVWQTQNAIRNLPETPE